MGGKKKGKKSSAPYNPYSALGLELSSPKKPVAGRRRGGTPRRVGRIAKSPQIEQPPKLDVCLVTLEKTTVYAKALGKKNLVIVSAATLQEYNFAVGQSVAIVNLGL